jgi:hypothetical protein
MSLEVEIGEVEVERWIGEYLRKRRPHLERAYRAAWEAFRRSLSSGVLKEVDLTEVVRAARAKEATLWDSATGWLAALTRNHPEARQAVRSMSLDGLAHVRFNALCCLGSRSSRPLLLDVILPAINDKSSRVRWKAVDKAGAVELREAIPVIEDRRRVEQDPKVRRTIDFTLPLLRDGYTLEERDGELHLTVSAVGGIRGGSVTRAEIERRGLPAIVEEWREELKRGAIRIKYLP